MQGACIGLLKARFRCQDKTGGTLLYDERKCCAVVIAAAILHNICVHHRVPIEIDWDIGNEEQEKVDDNGMAPAGIAVRRELIANRFA